MIPHHQLVHDLLAWIDAGQSPHALPGTVHVARLLDALHGGERPLLCWSRPQWRYALTPYGEALLAAWNVEHTPSEPVVAALLLAAETAGWERAG